MIFAHMLPTDLDQYYIRYLEGNFFIFIDILFHVKSLDNLSICPTFSYLCEKDDIGGPQNAITVIIIKRCNPRQALQCVSKPPCNSQSSNNSGTRRHHLVTGIK